MLTVESPFASEVWHQDVADVQGNAEVLDQFGDALATGDFNGDGFVDLASGVPEEVFAGVNEGAVSVLYGTANGLSANGNQFWSQADFFETPTNGGLFGSALASGDFNRDGFDDLAIGVPNATVDGTIRAGAVVVIFGSRDGLANTDSMPSQVWDQVALGAEGDAQAESNFGEALLAADFNDDMVDDLAIGVPDKTVDTVANAGEVRVLYGVNQQGLQLTNNQTWHQNVDRGTEILDAAETGDRFGAALAAGDFNADGNADLVVGIPNEAINNISGAGAISVIFGNSVDRLTTANNQFWHQGLSTLEGVAEVDDNFGFAIAAGDINNDGLDDVAVGVPGQNVAGAADAGTVHVLFSASRGIVASGNTILDQSLTGFGESPEANDRFGSSLAAEDIRPFNPGDEIIIGVPNEDFTAADVGLVHIVGTTTNGVFESEELRPNDFGLQETAGELFGHALATGDFDGDPRSDLAIGIPLDEVEGTAQAGATAVAYYSTPWVRISPADGQSDPATSSPVLFDIQFSETVSGLAADEIQLSGVAGAAVVELTGNGATYQARIEGMTTSGVLTAVVPAGVVTDTDGNSNLASTNTDNSITFNLTGVSTTVEQAAAQADPTTGNLIQFEVTFGESVTGFFANDLVLSGTAMPTTATVLPATGIGRVFVITVSGMSQPGTVVASIPAGVVTPFNLASTSMDNEVTFNPVTWTNSTNRFDVNNDGFVTSRDVLLIINELNDPQFIDSTGRLPTITDPPAQFLDVSGDGFATSRDVLIVINEINGIDQQFAAALIVFSDDADEESEEEDA